MRNKTNTYTTVILVCFCLLLFSSCKTSKKTNNTKLSLETKAFLKQLENADYRINITTVKPLASAATQRVFNDLGINKTGNTATRVDVTADEHFISNKQGNIESELPYFGEQRQATGQYGQIDSGIHVNSIPKNYTINAHKKKDAIVISFSNKDVKRGTENYDFSILVYANKKVTVSLSSSHRTLINYLGTLQFLTQEKDE